MIDRLASDLVRLQGRDGAWGYHANGAWTEPASFAILALQASGQSPDAVLQGQAWLRKQQQADGGWPPQPSIPQSTWVTALAILALGGTPVHRHPVNRGIVWLCSQVGGQASWSERLIARLTGQPLDQTEPGWSWYPGTASWVTPTALTVLALSKLGHPDAKSQQADRVHQGCAFLLARRCADGGWHHGGSSVRNEGAHSFPETTGMALTALKSQSAGLNRSLDLAEHYLANADSSTSAEAQSWLTIALITHGRTAPRPRISTAGHTTSETALLLLAESARVGRNVFDPASPC